MSQTDSSTIAVRSPFTGEVVGEVSAMTAADVQREVSVAHHALADEQPAHERALVLERAAELLVEQRAVLAETIMLEAGKPIALAEAEVDRAVDTMRFSAIEARTLAGQVVPMSGSSAGDGHFGVTLRVPVGVVAAITPFNFPLNLCCHKVGPAIAAGCPIVHKPASATPLTARLLHEIVLASGLPEERYRLVTGSGGTVGDALVVDPRISHVTFTGSSDVGWGLRARAHRASVGLELGNSTPLVVFADADLDAAASAVAVGGFGYAGQSCISVQRVLIERSVYADLEERIVAAVDDVVVGDPADHDVRCGPLINDGARDDVLQAVEEAVTAGARRVAGGDHDGNVVEPIILADVDPGLGVSCHELFGPGVVLTPFDTLEEAIALANGTPYGLQAGVFTTDLCRAMSMAGSLDFGGVTINETPTFRADQQPYGGVKESGNTREGPAWAVREMTRERLVLLRF